jgi:energy-coupling factor transporter ATP-binding protein EcfA2
MDTTNDIIVTDEEVKIFGELNREEVLALSNEMKMKYFFSFQVKHKKLEKVALDILELLSPFNETSIFFIIGATGVGKTTLTKRIIRVLVESNKFNDEKDPSTVQFIYIPAPANGERSLSWLSIYSKILDASNEILINKKQITEVENNKMIVRPYRSKSLQTLRGALDSMLKNRKVKVIAMDEAYHLLRFGERGAVMDTLKSIVENKGTKLLLIGSYDLFDLAKEYGQVIRRSEIIHFERYHIDNKYDVAEFSSIINKLQNNWPCQVVPNFTAISHELMQATLGCIGLLKALMLRALSMQLKNKGKWDAGYLTKAAKSLVLINGIRKEIEAGEEKVKGATYGESLFCGQFLKDVAKKMNESKR